MKIIVTAAPLIGHLNPLLAAGRILAEMGHEVVGYTPSTLRRDVEANGLRFHPYPPEADIDASDLDRIFPERRTLTPGFPARKLAWERVFVERMDIEYRGLLELLREFPADLILAESMTYSTLPLLMGPRADRPAIVHVGVVFLQLSRDDRAPMFSGLPPATTDGELNAYARLAEQAKAEWFDPIDRIIDGVLATHDRPPLPMPFYDAMIRLPDLFLQAGVPGLEFPRRSVPPSLHYIGANPPAPGVYPVPGWAGDLNDGRKVVLVTQGTVANSNLEQLIGPTLKALAGEPDLIVVATTGGRPVEALGPLPENARVAEYLPYDWLMPKVDLLVTNGGYGTVTQALSLGIPLVQAGTTEDKREVAVRIASSGAGVALGMNEPTPPQIRAAARRVLDIPSYGNKARALAQEFQVHDLRRQIGPLLEGLTPQTPDVRYLKIAS